jgi:large subunit ribosomal protein L24e
MSRCVFCGREEHDFKGVHLIKNDGTIDFFCSSKCRKNALKLHRDRRKVKWTQIYKRGLKIAFEKESKLREEAKKKAEESRKIVKKK